jgi:MFS family permease
MPTIASEYGAPAATWLAVGACIPSTLCSLWIAIIERWKPVKPKNKKQELLSPDFENGEKKHIVSPIDQSSGNEQGTAKRRLNSSDSQPWVSKAIQNVLPRHFTQFPEEFWLIVVTVICYSTATITFIPLAPVFLEVKYFPNDPVSATSHVSIPDTLSVVLLPLAGLIADRIGRFSDAQLQTSPRVSSTVTTSDAVRSLNAQRSKVNQSWWSGIAILSAHLLFGWTDCQPSIPLLILGAGYAGYGSVLYGLMADVVTPLRPSHGYSKDVEKLKSSQDEVRIASAYGASGCLVNITFFVTPMITAFLITSGQGLNTVPDYVESKGDVAGYFRMECFFATVAFLGLVATDLLDRKLHTKIRLLSHRRFE